MKTSALPIIFTSELGKTLLLYYKSTTIPSRNCVIKPKLAAREQGRDFRLNSSEGIRISRLRNFAAEAGDEPIFGFENLPIVIRRDTAFGTWTQFLHCTNEGRDF